MRETERDIRVRENHSRGIKRKKLDSCESIAFRGGQILIHESKSYTIIEIHARLGWRMGKWSSAVVEGSRERNAKTVLRYSKQKYREDKQGMEKGAFKRG